MKGETDVDMTKRNSSSAPPLIELKNVYKRFPLGTTQVTALAGVDLCVHAGDFLAVTGPSGSGKTTLLNLIGCLDVPSSGRILISGSDVGMLSERALDRFRSRTIGFVFQHFNLVPALTAAENVALPLYLHNLPAQERKRRALDALAQVGLAAFADSIPDQLSGGQRQRVSIARALATQPQAIVADEPTANLDSVSAESIISLMSDLNRSSGTTFIFSTHDESLTRRVGRLLQVHDGVVREHPPTNAREEEVAACGLSL
jgi:putative ABC transport system ATP-binding protein